MTTGKGNSRETRGPESLPMSLIRVQIEELLQGSQMTLQTEWRLKEGNVAVQSNRLFLKGCPCSELQISVILIELTPTGHFQFFTRENKKQI